LGWFLAIAIFPSKLAMRASTLQDTQKTIGDRPTQPIKRLKKPKYFTVWQAGCF
jgi:hypothetical protein